jgi:D-tyrosyl-tRNA(Tyr) deacylase
MAAVRAVVQRATNAQVVIGSQVVGEIDRPGLVAFIGVTHTDTQTQARALAAKIHNIRILDGELSCADADAPLLVVSQFTLYADTRKGRRPSWNLAAPGNVAEPLVEAVVAELRARGATVATGRFGADMRVNVANDGPMTLIIDVD